MRGDGSGGGGGGGGAVMESDACFRQVKAAVPASTAIDVYSSVSQY